MNKTRKACPKASMALSSNTSATVAVVNLAGGFNRRGLDGPGGDVI
jgi:hypothetical protein